MTREKPLFRKITKRKQTHKSQITPRVVAAQCGEGPTTQIISAAHQAASLNTPQANFRLVRGPSAAPRIPASLEGYTPPRASLRLTRGFCEFVTPAPIPPTEELNALTRRGRPGQRRILANRTSDTAWESYPGAVPPTLPVRPSLALQGNCAGRPVSTPQHCAVHSRTACTPHPS
jgi:hypothetical protein